MPKELQLQGLRHGDFQVFGSKWPQIRTTYLCRIQNTYGTLKGSYQVNLQEKINYNQNFSEFSETEAINLKMVASFFQDTTISILAICSPRHLFLLLEHSWHNFKQK